MYGEHPLTDAGRAMRAILTNQLARVAPRWYVKLTGETGRGRAAESAPQTAAYFHRCFNDYLRLLGVGPEAAGDYLRDKAVLEYGPGDLLGMALLLVAHGAEKVICVDRFPLLSGSRFNIEVLRQIMDGLEGAVRARADNCFNQAGEPTSGFRPEYVEYRVRPDGLSGLNEAVDLIISRAVLEHIHDLPASFMDMRQALRKGGFAIHQVDLKSHGLHRRNPLDFLTWPQWLWNWMYSEKGAPNRWRVDRYRQVVAATGLEVLLLEPTTLADERDIAQIRPYLAAPFRAVANEDLAWLGFWLVCRKSSTGRR